MTLKLGNSKNRREMLLQTSSVSKSKASVMTIQGVYYPL